MRQKPQATGHDGTCINYQTDAVSLADRSALWLRGGTNV